MYCKHGHKHTQIEAEGRRNEKKGNEKGIKIAVYTCQLPTGNTNIKYYTEILTSWNNNLKKLTLNILKRSV